MRKPANDETAREAATRTLACRLERFIVTADNNADVTPTLRAAAEQVVDTFPYAEQDTVTRDVQGERVTLRRVVLTGPWEVVHDA